MQLTDGLKIMEKWAVEFSRYEVLEAVQTHITTINLKTRFKNNIPGEDWYMVFVERHRLSLKKLQGV